MRLFRLQLLSKSKFVGQTNILSLLVMKGPQVTDFKVKRHIYVFIQITFFVCDLKF